MTKLHWTLTTLAILGGTAHAQPDVEPAVGSSIEPAVEPAVEPASRADVEPRMDVGVSLAVETSGSKRGVAQDYLVLPAGGELTAQMKFVTAPPMPGAAELRFSDLALFSLGGRWSLLPKLEVAAAVDFLPKQPSETAEKPWQSVGLSLRTPLRKRVAVAISGAGGHLTGHSGMWTREAVTVQWRKPIARVMTYDISGGVNAVSLSAKQSSALMTEVAVQTSVLFREPSGHWGGWAGLGYAVPVTARGADPTTGLAIDPQPRLDFRIGTALSLVRAWDLYVEFAVVDRGDAVNPATQLPILDGGFDQHQIMFGVTRHITVKKPRTANRDPMQMSQR
ncbi:MAG: hypothetical protein M3680_22945 [Myxococcota bacterium]|nr:hypothetical protein [Myxococcota bacterium]